MNTTQNIAKSELGVQHVTMLVDAVDHMGLSLELNEIE